MRVVRIQDITSAEKELRSVSKPYLQNLFGIGMDEHERLVSEEEEQTQQGNRRNEPEHLIFLPGHASPSAAPNERHTVRWFAYDRSYTRLTIYRSGF